MAKLGFFIPRTLSQAISSHSQREDDPAPFHVSDTAEDATTDIEQRLRRRPGWSRTGGDTLPQRVVRIGRSIISSGTNSGSHSRTPSRPISAAPSMARGDQPDVGVPSNNAAVTQPALEIRRTVRFPDETHRVADT